MRLKKTTFTILAVCCALNAQAADDVVMIDLTVLDSLNGGYQVSDEPLFPIMPKAATKAKVKASAPKVKKEVKVEVNKDIKSVPETTQQTNKKVEEVVVVDIEPTLPQKENIISDVETKEILRSRRILYNRNKKR